jgi:uncharacterized protein (DUF302 family)
VIYSPWISLGLTLCPAHLIIAAEDHVSTNVAAGIESLPSKYTVDKTLERLQSIFKDKGVAVFAVVDHSGEAEKVGFEMRPTKLVLFGNPKGGTPLMIAAPTVAIDLPLKALIWEDSDCNIWISYNSPEYLQQRHQFPLELIKNIAGVVGLLKSAGE